VREKESLEIHFHGQKKTLEKPFRFQERKKIIIEKPQKFQLCVCEARLNLASQSNILISF
jgi:hypothetical protein